MAPTAVETDHRKMSADVRRYFPDVRGCFLNVRRCPQMFPGCPRTSAEVSQMSADSLSAWVTSTQYRTSLRDAYRSQAQAGHDASVLLPLCRCVKPRPPLIGWH